MHRPPVWLAHPLRWPRGVPVPWPAVLRGALGTGPALALGLAAGRPAEAIAAGLGALFGTLNDRPGTRRVAALRIGLPALAGAAGFFGALVPGWWALPLLTVVGLVSGALSVAGPVWSAAAVQLLVLTAVGAGMPVAAPPWAMAAAFLAGALWQLLLRLVVSPSAADGERHAVAAVFDALADALAAVGTPGAESARRRLTGALDEADLALRLRWPRGRWADGPSGRSGRSGRAGGDGRPRTGGPADGVEARQLRGRFGAAAALCEASVALLWEGERLPGRIVAGPRRLAEAVRAGAVPGAVPAPVTDSPARAAFDRAVLGATLAFSGTADAPAVRPRPVRPGARPGGPAGREYGLRVAACVAVPTALALLLGAAYWYWLPVTAAFLVKPDIGPLFSRVVSRFAGTAVGVLLAAVLLPHGAEVAAATLGGALVPLAARHFAAQTAVVTVTVLAFVSLAGDTSAAGTRLADTALACAAVLLVGHLPRLSSTRTRVGHRYAVALRHAHAYLDHVLTPDPSARTERDALRRTAYRALAEARAAAETAAAELRADRDWLPVGAGAERIVDATTACAVRLDHGRPYPPEPAARRITEELAGLARELDAGEVAVRSSAAAPADCRTLAEIHGELRRIRALTAAR
ncbi:FUSC family protein [Kitasatospora sp. NPDC051853]|uniref:FUSC family protein n=1 Tax=Kitasatospora sp. NPDC051853 TaxID=3364058 RepID=UPI0037929D87